MSHLVISAQTHNPYHDTDRGMGGPIDHAKRRKEKQRRRREREMAQAKEKGEGAEGGAVEAQPAGGATTRRRRLTPGFPMPVSVPLWSRTAA